MEKILTEIISNYLEEKSKPFAGNYLADKLRKEFPNTIRDIITDKNRYKVVGSPGKGNWAECPWIAVFDRLITETAQSGFYPVFLFKANMQGVYLSLNQGVTEAKENFKRETGNVLKLKSEEFRAKLDILIGDETQIYLNSNTENARLYECGNIVARYYSATNLPTSEKLLADIYYFLGLYEQLTFNDTTFDETENLTAIEKKQYRLHYRIERNSSLSKKVKLHKGYKCEACDFEFNTKYGEIGKEFIEAHHLKPISSLNIGKIELNLIEDFAVLCSNCHRMIHKLDNPSDLRKLKMLIKNYR